MNDADLTKQFRRGAVVSLVPLQVLGHSLDMLDYRVPENGCNIGDFVEAPLGPRKIIGVVWGEGRGGFDPSKLRAFFRVLDVPAMGEELREFLGRSADYTLTPMPAMVRLATRVPGLGEPPGTRKVYLRGGHEPERMTEARSRILDALEEQDLRPLTQAEILSLSGVSSSVLKGLVALGAVREEEVPRDLPFASLEPDFGGKTLSEAQTAGAEALIAAQRKGGYGTTLLQGVTGSGKTEVYLEAVAETLRQGRQALVLLPEIGLTAEFLSRVEARFGARPAEWHSGVTLTERRRAWIQTAEGGAQLVVGARSALFLPFRDLGLIVVDEEHDPSYKQEEGVLYNARDMAVLRASIAGARVVLASATPSLESWANADAGKYERVLLADRFGAAAMPEMRAVDLRVDSPPSGRWISEVVENAVRARVAKGEQSLLFLNRRGYAPVTVCRACGHQVGCPNCDARMVEHRFLGRLMCHQCGETAPVPSACPSCGVEGKLAALGPGVERLAEEAIAIFPESRVAVLSSDMYGSARALKAEIENIAAGGADVIIGTQLVAKGHNFPLLTLVAAIDADLGLQGSDLRAAERTFQLIRQVAGRAGRSEGARGMALLQTLQPEHPVIRAILAGDDEAFWRAEADARRAALMPPYGRLAGIIISAPDAQSAFDFGAALARRDQGLRALGAEVYGPAAAPIARIRGRHRVRLLVKAPKGMALQKALSDWVAQVKLPTNLRLSIDIDPQTFF
jgi:primosomal protein N' (replication factor Y)